MAVPHIPDFSRAPADAPPIVHLARCADYDDSDLDRTVARLLADAGCAPAPGTRVLVKPNLISAKKAGLSCTHPRIVRSACLYLLDCGARVAVGDSPAFGNGVQVARQAGLTAALQGLDVTLTNLDRPTTLMLRFADGGSARIGVSRRALEADMLVSVPKLKAHCQMRMTCAVKNIFGCVTGMRKPLAHTRFGERGNRFESMLLDLHNALPPAWHLVDAVEAMHRDGPIGGDPFHLGLLAASDNAVALDSTLFTLVDADPETVPTWLEARRRALPGAFFRDVALQGESLGRFNATGFEIPPVLKPVSFHPTRLVQGAVRRVAARLSRS